MCVVAYESQLNSLYFWKHFCQLLDIKKLKKKPGPSFWNWIFFLKGKKNQSNYPGLGWWMPWAAAEQQATWQNHSKSNSSSIISFSVLFLLSASLNFTTTFIGITSASGVLLRHGDVRCKENPGSGFSSTPSPMHCDIFLKKISKFTVGCVNSRKSCRGCHVNSLQRYGGRHPKILHKICRWGRVFIATRCCCFKFRCCKSLKWKSLVFLQPRAMWPIQ